MSTEESIGLAEAIDRLEAIDRMLAEDAAIREETERLRHENGALALRLAELRARAA